MRLAVSSLRLSALDPAAISMAVTTAVSPTLRSATIDMSALPIAVEPQPFSSTARSTMRETTRSVEPRMCTQRLGEIDLKSGGGFLTKRRDARKGFALMPPRRCIRGWPPRPHSKPNRNRSLSRRDKLETSP